MLPAEEREREMKCPHCLSGKIVSLFRKTSTIDCPHCNGTMEVDDRHPQWRAIGQKCKVKRLWERDETIREFSERTGISASQISRWECGDENPEGHPDFEESMKEQQ